LSKRLFSVLFFCIALFLFFPVAETRAQVNANFSASPLRGCAPLVVQFTDLSTGGPTTWSWNFGNSNTSTQQNPATIYTLPGAYSVTLTVSNGSSNNTIVKTAYIVVYNKPVANFSVSSYTACVGQALTFTDSSIISSGGPPIGSWGWDFGDGNTQTVSTTSVTHTYNAPGNYPVSLIITDTNGCSNTVIKNVNIIASPNASFTASPLFSCTAPLLVMFTNTSTSGGPTTYTWNFGNGNTSTQTNPGNTYTAPGSYNVTLIANQNGCTDTITMPNQVVIQNINVSFVATPSVICSGQAVTFTNTSAPNATTANWNFGDGNTSTALNPVHTYTAAGTYTVSLTSSDANNCSGNASGVVTVDQTPVVSFTADTLVACSAPFTVNFNNTTVGGSTYNWNFGDGNSSTLQNPSHTYNAPGTYTVSLSAVNSSGTCADSITQNSYIIIAPPIAGFISAPDSGCVPLTVSFTSTSSSSIDPITSYTWNYGDGNSATTAVPNSTNTYTATGIFSPSLIIQTANGCTDTFVCNNCVKAGILPTADFGILNDTVCYGMPVNFSDSSLNSTGWYWMFGDGGNSTMPNPTYVYGDTGSFQVMLVAYNNGCADTSLLQNVVIQPPKAVATYTLSCVNYFTVLFASASVGADSLYWDFGDGSADSSNNLNPTHTYASTGAVSVTLTAYNYATGCSHSTNLSFIIAQPIASYSVSPVQGCYPFSPVFASTSQDANVYDWNFGDPASITDTSTQNNPGYTYNLPGTFTVQLIITDVNGCKDSVSTVVKSLGPIPAFYADTLTGCRPLPVTFVDSSYSDSALVQWTWDFGDGTIVTTNNDSITHVYTTPGVYNVTMSVKDTNQCLKTITVSSYIQPTYPYPAFSLDTFACKGDLLTFNASATSAVGPQYSWDFGDGTQTTTSNPIITHTFVNDSLYVIKLTVTDTNGCDSTITDTVRILKPIADFGWSIVNAGCGTLQVAFTDSSFGYVTGWNWNFGNGANSNLQNPIYTYTQPGIYNVSLIVTNAGGCTDTLVQDSIIVVAGPIGSFSFTPNNGCSPLTVVFTGLSSNTEQYIWDFGDGTVVNNGDSIVHVYMQQGTFNPVLVLGNTLSNGTPCLLPATNLSGAVTVINVVSASVSPNVIFIPEDSAASVFTAASGGTLPYTFNWSPSANINCANCPNITITGSGDTLVYVMTITDANGCGTSDTVLVYSRPCLEDKLIPNIFTPNEDGKNDAFYIPGVCPSDAYALDIFDRWGALIFSTTERNKTWDGKTNSGENAPDGTYYFIVKVADITYKGFLQLTR